MLRPNAGALAGACLLPFLPIAAAQDAAGPAQPAPVAAGWSPTAALVAGAADRDRSGDTTPGEWVVFVEGLRLDQRGAYGRVDVQAALLRPLLDASGDGWIDDAELEAARARWDANGDGDVDAREFAAGARSFDDEAAFVQELVLHLADGFGAGGAEGFVPDARDGATTAAEWARFLAGAAPRRADTGALAPSVVMEWIEAAKDFDAADRNAFTPDVYLLTLAADLDVDKDGAIRPGDLQALYGALDANGDGAISAEEFARPAPDAAADARPRFERSFAEQRELPPLMPFQRSLEDALLLVERTGKPLLVCVNMDGENASERLAWYHYRDPGFADLARGFVCVLASPDRRQAFDHDDRGRRLADERFGRVVDAEHVEIEPELFERYFSGTRAAPRHVGVAPDGRILFDIFLVQDLSVIGDALAEHGVRPGERPRPAEELSLDELLDSPEHAHRAYLEDYFVAADPARRRQLLEKALSPVRLVQHPQLVRLGLFDPDASVRAAAIAVVASRPGALPRALVTRALNEVAPGSRDEDAVVDGLRRLERSTEDEGVRAFAQRTLAVRAGLRARTSAVDEAAFAARLAVAPTVLDPFGTAADVEPSIEALKVCEALLDEHPDDPHALALFAAAHLRCGRAQLAAGGNPLFHFEDARSAARRAGDAGLLELAYASWLLSDFDGAQAAAEAALPGLAARAELPLALEVLRVFVRTRVRSVYAALGGDGELASSAVADLVAAHRAIARHPLSTAEDVVERATFLGAIDAWEEQTAAVAAGLERFAGSQDLHAWRRSTLLRNGGARALADGYAAWREDQSDRAFARWYEGLALLFAAEHAVRVRDDAAALEHYGACVAAYDEVAALDASYLASSAHYAALASAGAARRHLEAGRYAEATAAIEAAFAYAADAPGALDAADGLGETPRATLDALVEALLAVEDGAVDAGLVARCSALLGE